MVVLVEMYLAELGCAVKLGCLAESCSLVEPSITPQDEFLIHPDWAES